MPVSSVARARKNFYASEGVPGLPRAPECYHPVMRTVLIADDHQIVRAGFRLLVEGLPEQFRVVAEADDGRSAADAAEQHQPDIALVDVSMPESSGEVAAREILRRSPRTRVIACSMHADAKHVTEMFRAGAVGYVLKSDAPKDLAAALKAVAAGRVFISPNVAGHVVSVATAPSDARAKDPLSAREREVLQLIAEGASTKEIARRLCVSVKTVESHRKNISDKLEIRTVAGLTKYALREGLTTP